MRNQSSPSVIMIISSTLHQKQFYKPVNDFVVAGIVPESHSPGMFSWFPIFFPIKVNCIWIRKAQAKMLETNKCCLKKAFPNHRTTVCRTTILLKLYYCLSVNISLSVLVFLGCLLNLIFVKLTICTIFVACSGPYSCA